ncbi:multiple epidermal growth factor-like domains protein 6 isoform X1 [Aplysia californica]|uniref:Multiple epidermal growth factor-like domains protein 6 isoform X1 n=1 Tax=Aplysia californica TaxID=6500 RepID=A0ABM0K6F2_APLCA|nr:multiple epidermal growth factor-like domains protein 6 isoform X1 [Aplysia californica]
MPRFRTPYPSQRVLYISLLSIVFTTQCSCQIICEESNNRTIVEKYMFRSFVKGSYSICESSCRKYDGWLAAMNTRQEFAVMKLISNSLDPLDTLVFLNAQANTEYNLHRYVNGTRVDNMEFPTPWCSLTVTLKMNSKCITYSTPSAADKNCLLMFPCDSGDPLYGFCETYLNITGEYKDCEDTLCICPGGKLSCSCPKDCLKLYATGHCDYSPCRYDRYGPSCEYQCRCKDKEPCDLVTGNCPNGCQENWRGAACNETACPVNRFGPFCKQFCFCKYGDQCNVTTGDCYYGCEDQMYGRTCETSDCWPGMYGPKCRKPCSLLCGGGVPCSRTDGRCMSEECPVPFRVLPFCNQTVCPDGKWGSNCDKQCECEPPIDTCDVKTGLCFPHRSVPKELLTNSSCPEGLWGNYCHMTCMDKACQSCLKTNGGYCEKCRDGYNLTATKDCEKDSFVLMILVVFLCVLLLILVALLLLLLKRSTKKKEDKTELVEEEQDVKEEEEEEENATPSVEGEAEGKERGSEGQVDGEEGEHHDEADDEEHPAA